MQSILGEIVKVQVNVVAKRKLNKSLSSYAHDLNSFPPSDSAQVYTKVYEGKRGSSSSPCVILHDDKEWGFLIVPDCSGKQMIAAFEETHILRDDNLLSSLVQSAIYALENFIDRLLHV